MQLTTKRLILGLGIAAMALVSMGLARDAGAKEWSHPSSRFTFWLPDTWKARPDGEALVATDPSDAAAVAFFPARKKNLKEALGTLDTELARFVKRMKLGYPSNVQIRSLDAMLIDGTGVVDGEKANLGVGVYLKRGQVQILFVAAKASAGNRFDETLSKILRSVQR